MFIEIFLISLIAYVNQHKIFNIALAIYMHNRIYMHICENINTDVTTTTFICMRLNLFQYIC